MDAVDKALETQLANIEAKTGTSLPELYSLVLGQGFEKHGQMLAWAKSELGLGHGDANALVHMARRSVETAPEADPIDAIYTGKKAHFRSIHDALMARFQAFGDFDVAPKKSNVSLRRRKQFALIGPKTQSRFEIGINLKGEAEHPLLKAEKPGGMCQFTISLTSEDEIDDAMIAIVRRAYEAAGQSGAQISSPSSL
ncbi:MAG: DUF4287 domain-containing protein [Pseudomonadota bacterium]